jgi:hypothetical protein
VRFHPTARVLDGLARRPRSLASSRSPSIAGALFAAGAMATPLVLCGVLKSV